MRRTGARAVLLTAALSAFTLSACSSGSEPSSPDAPSTSGTVSKPGSSVGPSSDAPDPLTPQEQEYADAAVAPMQAQSDTPLADDEARCFSEGAVRVVGVDTLAQAGTPAEAGKLFTYYDLSTLDIDAATAAEVVGVLDTCGIDLRGKAITAARSDVSPAAAKCIESGVDDEAYRQMLVTQFHRGVEAFEQDVLNADKASGLDEGQLTWITFAGCVVDHMPAG